MCSVFASDGQTVVSQKQSLPSWSITIAKSACLLSVALACLLISCSINLASSLAASTVCALVATRASSMASLCLLFPPFSFYHHPLYRIIAAALSFTHVPFSSLFSVLSHVFIVVCLSFMFSSHTCSPTFPMLTSALFLQPFCICKVILCLSLCSRTPLVRVRPLPSLPLSPFHDLSPRFFHFLPFVLFSLLSHLLFILGPFLTFSEYSFSLSQPFRRSSLSAR